MSGRAENVLVPGLSRATAEGVRGDTAMESHTSRGGRNASSPYDTCGRQ